jgi:hypothetical protein
VEDMREWVKAIESHSPRIQSIKRAGQAATAGSGTPSMNRSDTDSAQSKLTAHDDTGSTDQKGDSGWLPAGQGHVAELPEDGDEI